MSLSPTSSQRSKDHDWKEGIIFNTAAREAIILTTSPLGPIHIKILSTFQAGLGDQLYEHGLIGLQQHPLYLFEEGEHSALILKNSNHDSSGVYHLAVGNDPLTWHKHPDTAHRIIDVTTGSGGAFASFSLATEEEITQHPIAFQERMVSIQLPADSHCLIRFPGSIYHQFGPQNLDHPAFIGISVHKNEHQELLSIQENRWENSESLESEFFGSIPLLTRYLPESARHLTDGGSLLNEGIKIYL